MKRVGRKIAKLAVTGARKLSRKTRNPKKVKFEFNALSPSFLKYIRTASKIRKAEVEQKRLRLKQLRESLESQGLVSWEIKELKKLAAEFLALRIHWLTRKKIQKITPHIKKLLLDKREGPKKIRALRENAINAIENERKIMGNDWEFFTEINPREAINLMKELGAN